MSRDIARSNIRIQNTTRVGKLTLPSNETGIVQRCQIYLNQYETMDNIHSLQLFGFASAMPVGTDCVVVTMAGDNSNGCVIASGNNTLRPLNMASGEAQIYDSVGQKIYLSQTGGVTSINIVGGQKVVITASIEVDVTAPSVVVTGNLTVNGSITTNGNITATGSINAPSGHIG